MSRKSKRLSLEELTEVMSNPSTPAAMKVEAASAILDLSFGPRRDLKLEQRLRALEMQAWGHGDDAA